MEMHTLICDNLGMTRDTAISALSKGEDGSTNFAFENHNIRILANGDDTKFTVANERSTEHKPVQIHPQSVVTNTITADGDIKGVFLGGGTVGKYLVIFVKCEWDESRPDCIYRLNYDGTDVHIKRLYKGNLNFKMDAPIEAFGYYEAEEVQKIYWLDGVNPNRFINVSDSADISKYNDNSFDFQGFIGKIPEVSIKKNYNIAGYFQAGTLQYFITYFNKYGIETGLVYNSDLQYISFADRGGKADEAVSCAFDFDISNIDTNYQYLRLYACYRSGENGEVTARKVIDVALSDTPNGTISFTDNGTSGENFNAQDIPYVGGQDIRANTMDYKQDTLFLGDVHVSNTYLNAEFPKEEVTIREKGLDSFTILEGGLTADNSFTPFIRWAYKRVSGIATSGNYSYENEMDKSQGDIAGFKWREVYRFGIQFMNNRGEWTSAIWLGDKYCDYKPYLFTESMFDAPVLYDEGDDTPQQATPVIDDEVFGYKIVTVPDPGGSLTMITHQGDGTEDNPTVTMKASAKNVYFTEDGCYIPTAIVDQNAIIKALQQQEISLNNFVAYRLLVADTNITNRRIVSQGVLNPTMFCYADRYFNRPFSIPSWIFRPRKSNIVNRHYETLPVQTEKNAELQGIVEKNIPGFAPKPGPHYNAMMFIYASNAGSAWSGYEQWKLIYYNCGTEDINKAELLYLQCYTGHFPGENSPEEPSQEDKEAEWNKVAELMYKYELPLQLEDSYPGNNIIKWREGDNALYKDGELKERTIGRIVEWLKKDVGGRRYVPCYIYGSDYKIISSRWEHYKSGKDKQGTLAKWSTLRGWLVDEITADMRATKEDDVGEELAGRIVLSPEMLPSTSQIKAIARAGSDASAVGMAIMAALVAAAAVVISCLSFGTLSGPMAVVAAIAISAATTALAGGAVGAASASAMLSLEGAAISGICSQMLSKGYLPAGGPKERLDTRKERSKAIGRILDKFFEPAYYVENSSLSGYSSWNVPFLKTEPPKTGRPFRTGHPYTEKGYIGMDYNAFIMTGKLSGLDLEEQDLKYKQNLFCVDESIVTLNAPDLEENYYSINNVDNLTLAVVGVVPVDACRGIYDMNTEGGNNSASQVFRSRFKEMNIGDPSDNFPGMLNGDIYQDFKALEDKFGDANPKVTVNETVDTYRTFMWNRAASAGFSFPNVTLTDGFGETVTTPRGKIIRKVFANMRYSINTDYVMPYYMGINSPAVCLDNQVMLKTLEYADDVKNYYENVDTVSVNAKEYPLICNGLSYPSKEDYIRHGGLKDPIAIRYKQTPHAVLPLKWNEYWAAATILPHLKNDEALMPSDLYDIDKLEDVHLYGTRDSIPVQTEYYYLEAYHADSKLYDDWNTEGVFAKFTRDQFRNTATEELATELLPMFNKFLALMDCVLPRDRVIRNQPKYGKYGFQTADYLTMSQCYDMAKDALGEGYRTNVARLFKNIYYVNRKRAPEGTKHNHGRPLIEAVGTWFLRTHKGVEKVEDTEDNAYKTTYIDCYKPWLFKVAPNTYYLITCTTTRDSNGMYNSWEWASKKIIDVPTNTKLHVFSEKEPDNRHSYLYGNFFSLGISNEEACVYPVAPYDATESDRKEIETAPNKPWYNYNFHIYSADVEEAIYYITKGEHPDLDMPDWYEQPEGDINNEYGKDLTTIKLSNDLASQVTAQRMEGTWYQPSLDDWDNVAYDTPYLFLGELVRKEFDYDSWNGGISDYALKQLVWNVASGVTPMNKPITRTWGDTFYQRWDCQKTYPFTEEDANSNVEILSFMVESHDNLDGRCDVNRGTSNLLNTRPSNTLRNHAYDQKDNFFTYQVLDEKFAKTHFESDVVWSLTKNNMDDIDKWTCLLSSNEMSLDGRYGTVRKILNVNDVLVAFQDTGIANIKYNETAALNTTSGLPLQMGNTGKVEGYRMISDTIGCHNKYSINKNSAGVFFIDDYGKSLNQMTTNNGIADISMRANFSTWFRKELNGTIWCAARPRGYKTFYDEITHDLYIINEGVCLVYNTLLQKFTSFMDYISTPMIARLISDGGKTEAFALYNKVNRSVEDIIQVWQLFGGNDYGYIYGKFREYSMEYRLNPDPLHDSIFTNYQFTADWTDPSKSVGDEPMFEDTARRYTSFDEVEAKNEYQRGSKAITPSLVGGRHMGRQPLRSMFRIWRGDIPRNGESIVAKVFAGDRMRNPWIHLTFKKTKEDNSRMVFHNLMITYYNQYGRL